MMPTLVIFFITPILTGLRWYFIGVLICISLMIKLWAWHIWPLLCWGMYGLPGGTSDKEPTCQRCKRRRTCMIFFMYYWILFAKILLRIFALMSEIIAPKFLFLWHSCLILVFRVLLASYNEVEELSSLLFFGWVWEGLLLLLWTCDRIHQWSHLVLLFTGSFLTTDSISLVIDLFRYSILSWFSLCRFVFLEMYPFLLGCPIC